VSNSAGDGLAHVASARLAALLSAIRAGRVRTPISAMGLKLSGFADFLSVCETLMRAGVGADTMLEVILADRAIRRGPSVELVWSGPSPAKSQALDTRAVVQRLFANAEDHVLICGFAFYQAKEIFATLHQRAQHRDLNIEFFVHFSASGMKSQEAFFKHTWPWRDIMPDVYFDPRSVDGEAAMHAKSVVVDGHTAFVTSANFTTAAQTANVEIGALIEDSRFASDLIDHWGKLKAMDVFVRVT
jgi:phosphatidylserine/phosphatidylglycerophosphate/cardiolipin synthase-like enzyme